MAVIISRSLIESSIYFSQSKLTIYCTFFLKHMTSFWWLILFFFIVLFFSLRSIICKKYTNTNGKDSKHANTIDVSIIWLFEGLFWDCAQGLFCNCTEGLLCNSSKGLFCNCSEDCSLLCNVSSFLFFYKCSEFMTLGDASRMFFSCYCFFLFLHHFLFNTKSTRKFVLACHLGYLLCIQKLKEKKMNPIFEHPVFDSARGKMKLL